MWGPLLGIAVGAAACGAAPADGPPPDPTLPGLQHYDLGWQFPKLATGCVSPEFRVVIPDRLSVPDNSTLVPVVLPDPTCRAVPR